MIKCHKKSDFVALFALICITPLVNQALKMKEKHGENYHFQHVSVSEINF